ncbi:Hypothetical protein NCS54_01370000 [Fusarium falciforme]|uniref:Hypothetical protein n=1 Tax=Fusarium falciforme TaxID=195108 RepID=UPI00230008B2|nr:Hypothetical protein NCS54_01370000 [Fusarium falciforme]WAO96041.1 Hypothetical protein NCS54_01370000 [Fusarium falciforme]
MATVDEEQPLAPDEHFDNDQDSSIGDVRHWRLSRSFAARYQLHNANIGSALEALTLAPFTRALGWKAEEVRTFTAQVRKDLNDRRIHAYWPIVSVYGQKPA